MDTFKEKQDLEDVFGRKGAWVCLVSREPSEGVNVISRKAHDRAGTRFLIAHILTRQD